ncbi:MAG: glycosyltransferase, partial [Candidatus Zixiibacteriota bacterium]
DLWFAATYVHLSLRDYDKSIDAARNYLRFANRSDKETLPDYAVSPQHQSQVLNMYGAACREAGDEDRAEAGFCAAIETDPRNHLPFLNLVNLLIHRGKTAQAREVIDIGLQYCRQVTELRLLRKNIDERPDISACMIVKDEEELLPGCLESIRDWVSEIIIVDTGSTDRTVEIAEAYGAKVFHQPWEGNFSKHRNYSLEQATGEWVFIIDADERLVTEDLPKLLPVLRHPDSRIVSVNVFNVYGRDEETTTFLPSIRFFRRELNLRYEGIVHNLLKLPEGAKVVRTGARIKHLGYDLSKEKMRKKIERSRALLEKQLAEDPDNAFALFNYAQLLRGEDEDNPVKNADLIIQTAARAVELTDPDNLKQRHIHIMCLNQLAWAYFYKGEYGEAMRYAELALDIKPNYLDPLLLRGHILVQAGRHDEAAVAYREYLQEQARYDATRETDNIIVAHIDSRVNAHYALGMIAEMREDKETAIHHYKETLALQPDYLEANARLGRVCFDEGDLTAAERYF